jgi:ankyrin repeat protein
MCKAELASFCTIFHITVMCETGFTFVFTRGHGKVVRILLDKGADVNAQGGRYGNALRAASEGGHEKVVKMLLDKDAVVNAQGGLYGNALQVASEGGHEKVVKMLLDAGAVGL